MTLHLGLCMDGLARVRAVAERGTDFDLSPYPLAVTAADALRVKHPNLSAAYGLSSGQWVAVISCAAVLAGSVAVWPHLTMAFIWAVAAIGFITLNLFRLTLASAAHPAAPPVIDPARSDWPVYSVIVPLYHEGRVLEKLIASLAALDYPIDRLDVLLMLEDDDADTHAALARLALPACIRVVSLPDVAPRTKPKACQAALELALGRYVTIYDAEDVPHPQQLKQAVLAFEAAPGTTACLQAPLLINNARDSWLSRQFALEYAVQFLVMVPGLARLGLPIALGGTSNHFRTDVLRAVGGWDPYNVTEDTDLGMRLSAYGYTCGYLPFATFEEAPNRFDVWVRQRSRWIKGYMQSWGVMMRDPMRMIRNAGLSGFLVAQLTLGAAIVSAFVHAPLVVWALWVLTHPVQGHSPFGVVDAVVVLSSFGVWLLIAAMAARRWGGRNSAWHAFTTPLYWPLLTVAAALALRDLIVRPHHWVKTPHGLAHAS